MTCFYTDNKIFNIFLLITIVGEFLLPWVLKHFYKGYNGKTMVMSVLGNPQSPVKNIYNVWLVWLGVFLLLSAFLLFKEVCAISVTLAVITFISIAVFAVGAGIISGFFSVNDTKENNSFSAKIHGCGSAIGFMSLLFFPLLQSIGGFMSNNITQGIICIIAFLLSVTFFVFFIMGDKEDFKGTIFSYEGLWQRLSLFFMYIPFLYIAINNLVF